MQWHCRTVYKLILFLHFWQLISHFLKVVQSMNCPYFQVILKLLHALACIVMDIFVSHTALLLKQHVRVGIISHSLNFFSLYDGEKECRGYTLFLHLITMGKKSGGYTFRFPPY